jgi:hypothetical protein
MSRIGRTAALAAAMSAGLVVPIAHSHDIHYSGSATGIKGTVTLASVKKSVTVADVAMACTGTAREETVSAVSNPQPLGLSAQTVHVFSIGRDNVAESTADIEKFDLSLADGFRVQASALTSHAEATCTEATRAVTTSGGSDVGSLFINGEGQAITGEPNQTFEVPGLGKVIVNEVQRPSTKEIIVYALRVIVADPDYPANGEVYFARSRAKVTCAKTTAQ